MTNFMKKYLLFFSIIFLSILFFVFIFYQKKNTTLYLYFENYDECNHDSYVRVTLDDSTYIKKLKYVNIAPHYEVDKFEVEDGEYLLKLEVDSLGLKKNLKVPKKGDTYVFIGISCSKIKKGDYDPNYGTTAKKDSIYKKSLDVDVRYELPVFH